MRYGILVSGLFCVAAGSVFADAPSVNEQSRSKMMGSAGTALRGSWDSPMMNPAGLQDLEERTWMFWNLTAEAPLEVGLVQSARDFKKVTDRASSTDVDKRAALEEFLREAGTETLATRVNFYPNFSSKYLHVGLLVDAMVNPRLRVGGLASNQLVEMGGSNASGGLILGSSYSFFKKSLQVGTTVKGLYRVGLTAHQQQTLLDVLRSRNPDGSLKNELLGAKVTDNASFGVGVDVGAKYWIPYGQKILKPSVGITLQDIGHTRFWKKSPVPADIKQSLSAGVAIHPSYRFIDFALAVDGRNLTEKQEFLNYLHVGSEALFWKKFAVRAGLSQGYVTGGLGVILSFFQFDAFVSAEEVGEYAHLQSQRTFGFRFSFDL